MANFEARTASNGPRLKPDKLTAFEELRGKYSFGEMTVGLTGDTLSFYGYCWPDVYLNPFGGDGNADDDDRLEEFLQALAPLLAEPLIIQAVGAQKCCFPVSGMQVTVYPDGRLKWVSLDGQVEEYKKRKYTVHAMTPSMSWENVEAYDAQEAKNQCDLPNFMDATDPDSPVVLMAFEHNDDDENEDMEEDNAA